jgi:hypothetical protein
VFVAFLAAAVGVGDAQPSIGPEFTKVLAVARLDADCYRGCPTAPVTPDRALDTAMTTADWRIEKPNDYVAAFRSALGKYLLDKRVRARIDATFTSKDSLYFETALNVLPPYLTCLETMMRSAPDASFAKSAAIDRLLDKADAACVDDRVEALKRIGFTGPDFHRFNDVADGGQPGAEVSNLLQHVQHFAVAYNVGLRGASWRRSIEVTVLPSSKPIQ